MAKKLPEYKTCFEGTFQRKLKGIKHGINLYGKSFLQAAFPENIMKICPSPILCE